MTELRTDPWVVEQVTIVHRANGVHGAQRRLSVEAAYRDAARSFIREQRECKCEADDCGQVALWAEGSTCPAHKPELRLVERVARLMRRADADDLVKVARDAAAMGREDDAKRLMSMRHAHQHEAPGRRGNPAPEAGCGVEEDEEDAGRGPGRSDR